MSKKSEAAAVVEINASHPAVIARKAALIANGTDPLHAEKLAIDAARCQAARDAKDNSPAEAALTIAAAETAANKVFEPKPFGTQPPSVEQAAEAAVEKSAGAKAAGDVPPQLEPARAAAAEALKHTVEAPEVATTES